MNSASFLPIQPLLEHRHLLGLYLFGYVDIRFHRLIIGMPGPFHDHLRRDAGGQSKADERATASMRADEFVLRPCLFLALTSLEVDTGYGIVNLTKLAKVLQVFVHLLVGDDRQGKAPGEALVLVLVQNGLCVLVEVDWQAVVGLLGGDIDVVAGNVGALEGGHIGVPEAGESAEAEEVPGLLQGGLVVDFLLILFALVVVEFDFGAVGRDGVVVDFEEFVLCEEDDGLGYEFELGLDGADFGFAGYALADSPVEEPAEVEVVLLDGVLSHLGFDTEVADEGIDAIVIEVIELEVVALGGEVLAEGVPAFHGAGRPLVGDALFFGELVKVGEDVLGREDDYVFAEGVVQFQAKVLL